MRKTTRKEPTVRWIRWITVTVLTMIAVAAIVGPTVFVSPVSAADDADVIKRLSDTLNGDKSTLSERNEAAMMLAERQTPQAAVVLANALQNSARKDLQLIVAKAIGQSSNPDPAVIKPLAALLGSSQPLTDAAAGALAAYHGNAEAFNSLKSFADDSGNSTAYRISAIHAMSLLFDPPAAEYLVGLSAQPSQSPAVQKAAMDALTTMTGVTSFGSNPQQWQQWWGGMNAQSRAQFLDARAAQYRLSIVHAQLVTSLRAQFTADYLNLSDEKKKSDALLRYLRDGAPDIRLVGVDLVHLIVASPPSGQILDRLYQMVSDSDDDVRFAIADLLSNLPDDPATLNPLIAQLGVERVPRVKKKIAQTLGKLADPSAAPALKNLLQDPQSDVVIAAANAFAGNLGAKLRQKDPNGAGQVSADLRAIIKKLQNQPNTADVRAGCMLALAALRDPASAAAFRNAFAPGEDIDVRRAAIRGLGNLGDKNADQLVADQLGFNDPKIRLEAALALQKVGTPGQDERIFHTLSAEDPASDLGKALWAAFLFVIADEPADKIKHWVTQFDRDPDKKLVVLEKLGDALQKAGDTQASAYNNQDIAAAMMAVKPPQIQKAIAQLQSALDYWRGPGKNAGGAGEKLEELVGDLLNDKLLTGDYPQATEFAAQQLPYDPYYQKICGPRICDKIDGLNKENKSTEARALIEAALKMNPSLSPDYVNRINTIQAEMKRNGQ